MSITVPPSVVTGDIAQWQTVESFTIRRLGESPSIEVTLVDTVADVYTSTVTAMVPNPIENTTTFIGAVLGSIATPPGPPHGIVGGAVVLAGVPTGATVASLEDYTVMFAAPLVTDLVGQVVTIAKTNRFGIAALRPAVPGRQRVLSLSSGPLAQFDRMATTMGAAHMAAVAAVLPHLTTLTPTAAQLQTAVQAASENLESLLATQFEQLEMEVRAGTFVGTSTIQRA